MRKLETDEIVPANEVKALIDFNKQLKRKAASQSIPKKPKNNRCPVCLKKGRWVLVQQLPFYLGKFWDFMCSNEECYAHTSGVAINEGVFKFAWAARQSEWRDGGDYIDEIAGIVREKNGDEAKEISSQH